jgi:hypothetical protein
MSWIWVPLASVGPISFGAGPETLAVIPGMHLEELKRSEGQLWSHYWSDVEGLNVMCVDQRIVSVACHEELIYRGRNLVGMADATARMQFRDQEVAQGEFPDGHTLEVFGLGLELTFRDDVVIIATAFNEPLAKLEM